jgi:hypothetical protein
MAHNLSEAFLLSQNIDSEWEQGERSTSVGDFIQDDDQFFMVENTSFKLMLDETLVLEQTNSR